MAIEPLPPAQGQDRARQFGALAPQGPRPLLTRGRQEPARIKAIARLLAEGDGEAMANAHALQAEGPEATFNMLRAQPLIEPVVGVVVADEGDLFDIAPHRRQRPVSESVIGDGRLLRGPRTGEQYAAPGGPRERTQPL